MRNIFKKNGFGIVEAVITLGIIAMFIAVFAKLFMYIDKANEISRDRMKAQYYAQIALEIINDKSNDFFACRCGLNGVCSETNCVLSDNSQVCDLLSAEYRNCWTAFPVDHNNKNYFYLEKNGNDWDLKEDLSADHKLSVEGDEKFKRMLKIESACRKSSSPFDLNTDCFGDCSACAGTSLDGNTKKITSKVWYYHKGSEHYVELSSLLTAWKNL
jgi:hypothetical protein